jgi:lipopolysaccharide export system permease protein
MPILDRYILRQVVGTFLFGVGLFTIMLEASFELFGLVRVVMQQGVGALDVVRLLALRVPHYVVFSMPMALLLGTLMAMGRLSDHNEVVALRTGGVSLGRVMLPVLLAGLLVGGGSLALGEFLVPQTNEQYFAELRRIRQAPPTRGYLLFREREGALVSVYYARRVAADAETLEGVVVHQEEGERVVRLIRAARATYANGAWTFEDGTVNELDQPGRVEVRFTRLRAGLSRTPREIQAERRDPSEMTIAELRSYIRILQRSGESVARYLVWLHARASLPLSSIPFALLALPLGLRPHRSGSSIGLGLTVLIILLYYLGFSITVALSENGRLPAAVAAWAPDGVVAAVGAVLLWRVR